MGNNNETRYRVLGSIPSILSVILLCGCAGRPVETFENEGPLFNPITFFSGHTHSWGVFETRSGKPAQIIHTETWGHKDGDALDFEQDIVFEQHGKLHRTWLVRQLDEHHFSATGTGIIGTARGIAYGSVFHLDFTLDALPGNPLGRVHMSQWMYLQPDGVTLVNRDTISKEGIIVTEITELFRKE
jgi:hypothetical protein